MLSIKEVSKVYRQNRREVHVLNDVTLEVPTGAVCALLGPSGSGKSTLLGLCAGLDRPTQGAIVVDDVELQRLDENALADFRGRRIGFIFQSFHLIPTLTALENVMVPAELRGSRTARRDATDLLGRVGLAERVHHYPTELSGGEQQRVAVARAYINKPVLLFGDEPTGNLDAETALGIEDLLFQLNQEERTTLVLATHNLSLAAKADLTIRLEGGKVFSTHRSEA